jgi:hypothetical protein
MILQIIIPHTREYNLIFAFTLVLLAVKLFLIIFLTRRVILKKKQGEPIALNFSTSVLLLMICLFVGRIFFIVFDFFITYFDQNLYPYSPGIYVWKIGSVFFCLGPLFMLYFIDKNVFHFKLKKAPEIFVILAAILFLLYPVREGVVADFQFVSYLGFIAGLGLFLIPIAFIIIIRKTTGDIKRSAILIVVSLIIYVIGGLFVNEGILGPLALIYGDEIRVIMHLLTTIVKSSGLILFTYSAIRFHV